MTNLRILGIGSDTDSPIHMLCPGQDINGQWEVYVSLLAKIKPLLRCVKDLDPADNYLYWVIDRKLNGKIVVNRRASY